MSPNLSAALRLVVEGDPHNDLPAAIDRLAADDQRAVRYLLGAQQKRIDRERKDAAARALPEAAIWGAAPWVSMTTRLSSVLRLVIDGIAPIVEQYEAVASLNAEEQEVFHALDSALQRRLDRERRDAAVIAWCQATAEAAERWAAREGSP